MKTTNPQKEAAVIQERADSFCKKHPKEKMTHGDCHRCGGNGFTESDLEDMDDPTTWHNSGNCYSCKGSGIGFLECEICEEDYRMEQEMDESL